MFHPAAFSTFSTLPVPEVYTDFCIVPVSFKMIAINDWQRVSEVHDLGLKIFFSSIPSIINSASITS